MAPKAIIETTNQISKDTLDIRGIFTDEVAFKFSFSLTTTGESDSSIIDELRRSYKKAINQESAKLSIKPGAELDLSDPIVIPNPPPPPPPIPTPEELAMKAYGEKIIKFKQFKGAVVAGLPLQAELDAIVADLVKDYIAGYEVFFSSIIA